VIAGEANYLLFHSPVPLAQAMREKGILLRDCSNYRGLSSGWYRAAVRTHAENTQLIAAIREVQI
jgi:threonine-phosphate decarboxylase